jgi:outer membrane protein TolC
MRRLLLLALGVLAPTLAVAQHAPLTLEDAVRQAMTTGPGAQAASGVRAVGVGRARADAQFANPMLELRRENEGAPIPYDDFATLTLPVSFTGRRAALRDALGAARTRGVADSLLVIREAGFNAAREWWNAWVTDGEAQFARAQALRFAELARFDSLRADEGMVAEASALRTRLEAERAGYSAAQAIGAAGRARAALAARLGVTDVTGIVLAELPDTPPAEMDMDADAAVREALERRPDVVAARAAVQEADRRRAAEGRGVLPDIGLSGGYKGTGGYATGQFGVIVTPPLLNANGGARERATGEWLLADAERRALEIRAAGEVRAALDAARAMDALTGGLDAGFVARADTIAAAADAAYREGVATLTETLEALRAVADVRAAGLRAIADRHLVRLELRRAMGAPVLEVP